MAWGGSCSPSRDSPCKPCPHPRQRGATEAHAHRHPLITFTAACLAIIEHDMKDAPVMCKYTVGGPRKHLGFVELELRAYLQLHLQTLEPYAAWVRDMLVLAITAGLDDAMYTLAVDLADLGWQHQLILPRPAAGRPCSHPPSSSCACGWRREARTAPLYAPACGLARPQMQLASAA